MSRLTRTHAYVWATVALVPSLLLGTGCGDDPVTPPPVKNPAKILSFMADRTTVPSGTAVTLSWRVENATSVTISSPAGVLVDKSPAATGTRMTAELTAQTTFTILAIGEGGNATNTVTISIAAPNEVQIGSFTASLMNVKPGDPVTLQWATMNATSITLSAMGQATPIVMSTSRLSDDETVNPMVTTTYVLVATGAAGSKQATVTVTVEGTPVITTFSAMPQAIELGGMATLSWSVTGASNIRVVDAAMNNVYDGDMGQGTQVVAPTQSTAYTLIATSMLGQEVRSMPVMVTVNRAAIVTSFTANPSTVDYGDPSELRWVVARAPGGIRITTGGRTVFTSSAAMGGFTVTPTVSTAYTLTAVNTDGDTTAMTSVTVNPIAPRIVRFDATPNPARITEQSTLSWSTIGASTVRVIDPTGTSVFSGTAPDGTLAVTVTGTIAQYTLETTNPNGGTTQTVTLIGQRDPIISVLSVRPEIFISTATTATVSWTTIDATSTTLTINGAPAAGFAGTATGTYTFTTTVTARLVLTAVNDVAQASREIMVLRLVDATVDSGNTAATAVSLGNTPGAVGVIGPTGGTAGDLDFYTFTVPNGGNVRAEISDGRGGCPFDSLVTLFAPDGTTVLGSDDDDGIGACSIIDPARDAFATNLAAGTYYVQVRGFGTTSTGRYVLSLLASPARCGNALLESRASEQCDDGNAVSGDSCSATCQAEPLQTVMGPGANISVGGAISPANNADFIRVDMLAEGYIGAEVFIPSRGRCDAAGTSADPVLTLFDANFVALGTDDNDGIASCARIDPTFDAFSRVPAGTYFLRITENGNDGVIPAYVVDVRTVGIGCGNALLEGVEECDDGNASDGDGCSSVCVFEGLREVEPNNTFATGTVIVTAQTSFIVRGSITPAADLDFYQFDVPAGYHVDAYVTVNSLDACPDDPEAGVALFNPAGTLQGSTNTTGGPQGNCGRVWPYTVTQSRGVAAGRWGIRVGETGDNAAIGVYFLHVNLIAPGCGNRIIEGTEQCEDGNVVSGDGCSATCGFEAVATVNISMPGTTTVAGSINPEFNRDAIRITATSTTYLRAETFVNAASRVCPFGTNTRLRLFNDNGTERGTDAIDGINSCSLINPQVDAFALVGPGNYWLVVEEDGNNLTIPSYDVSVRGVPFNVCGNGIIEIASGEQCDGQSFCSAACQIVPVGVVTGPTGTQTFTDAITPIGELDFYRVDVSAEAYITVETGAPTIGTCPTADTLVRIFSAATSAELFSDDDDGPGNCSLLPGASGPLPLVQPGTYFVRVEEFLSDGTIPAYQVRINVAPANVCGNGIRENAEVCDDGNVAAGDGCSPTCTVEPQGVHTGPGTPASVFTQAIAVVGEVDRYEINVTATAYLRAETFAPTAGLCDGGADTVIRLSNAAGTALGSDDEDGINSCSFINPAVDAFARLAPGQYFLSVEEFNNDAAIAAYVLNLNLLTADVCGNGVRELAETCDDGNTAAGDGCSPVCLIEPAGTINGPLAMPVSFTNAIETIASVDNFALTLTQPALVRIEVLDPSSATCAVTTFTPQLTLINANGANIEVDTIDNVGTCSIIGDRVLPAGSYTIRVNENGNNATLPNYTLLVTAPALTAAVDGTYAGPSATPQVFTGALDVLGDADVYQVTLSAPGRIVAETGNPIGTCASPMATVIRVVDPSGNEIAFDTLDAVNSCSLYDAADRFDVPAGTYFVVVEESGRNATILSYELRVLADAPPAYVCGDGYRDIGEQCDDGNAVAADGCTACVSDDVAMVQDNNVNNAFGLSQNLGTLATNSVVNVSGTIREGSAEWYRFTLAGPANVRINTYGTPGAVLTSCGYDSVMSLYNGQPGDDFGTTVSATNPTLIEYDDDEGPGPGACSIISGTALAPTRRALGAGTYWVQVRRFGNNTAVGQYYLNVDVAP